MHVYISIALLIDKSTYKIHTIFRYGFMLLLTHEKMQYNLWKKRKISKKQKTDSNTKDKMNRKEKI